MTEKRKRGRPKKVASIKSEDFTILMKVNGGEYTSTAPNLDEALSKLPFIKPATSVTFTIEKGNLQSKTFVLNIPNFNRLFYPGMTGIVQRASFVKRYSALV